MSQHTVETKDNVIPNITDEEKAYDILVMQYNRVALMDDMNVKALDRAGKVGTAVRDLLGAVLMYSRARQKKVS